MGKCTFTIKVVLVKMVAGFFFEDLCALNLNNHRKADFRKSGIVHFREAIACIMTS